MPAAAAHVGSVEALASLRAGMLIFGERAGGTLDEISEDVRHTKLWLENDRQVFWERQVRHRTRKLEEARAELFSARLSKMSDSTQLQQMAVNKAERALEEAETRLRRIRKWLRDFDHRVEPVARQLDKFRSVLQAKVPKAAAQLASVIQALEAYAQVKVTLAETPAPVSDPAEEPAAANEATEAPPA